MLSSLFSFIGAGGPRESGRIKKMSGRNTGKKPRVDEIEEELDPSQPRHKPRFPATNKTLAFKGKTTSQLADSEFVAKRRENPYVIERDNLLPHLRERDLCFHTAFQAHI